MRAKIYKLGKSGRLAIMLPKEAVFEPGEYEVSVEKVAEATAPENVEPIEVSQSSSTGTQ